MDWQPIETAPKDGTIVRTCYCNGWWSTAIMLSVRARYTDEGWEYDLGDRWSTFSPQPTHWDKASLSD
jgi:hypothetical protein